MTGLSPNAGIMGIAPYEGGKSRAPGGAPAIKLSSNETPLGPSPLARQAYLEAADNLALYPEGGCLELREALAATHGLDAKRIVCGNGSDDILALLAQAYVRPGDDVLYSQYGFVIYRQEALAHCATPVAVPEINYAADVDGLLDAVTDKTRILYIANPNNPTGTYLTASEVKRLHTGLPDNVLLVLDAAYAEYVEESDYDPGARLVDAHENVIMTRTFSKIYGLAALRLGWGYCSAPVADVLNRIRGPFNVNAPAQAAGLAALADTAFLAKAVAYNGHWRSWLLRELESLNFCVTPSVANFVLIHFGSEPGQTAADADAFLLSRGFILRRLEAYGLPDCLRLSVGREEDNRAVIAALKDFINT